MSSNLIPIQKSVFKNKETRTLHIIAPGGQRKTIKVKKVLRIKCVPVTVIVIRIVMIENNRCLIVRHGDHH